MEFGYLTGAIFITIIWVVIFSLRADLREKMVVIGFLLLPVVFYASFFVPEYWNPPFIFDLVSKVGFSLEDLLFMFFGSGVVCVSHTLIFGDKKNIDGHDIPFYPKRFIYFAFVLYASFLILNLLGFATHLYSSLIINVLLIAWIFIQRKDLQKIMLVNGLILGVLYFVILAVFHSIFPGFFTTYYNVENLWGVYVLGVPLEEAVWGFHFGTLLGGLYEYLNKTI
jgi:hypothetical protein